MVACRNTCCLPNLSAIVGRFVETRATIGNKISDESGQWLKTIYDLMSVMYGEHMPSHYQVEVWSKQFKWGRNLVEDDPKLPRAVGDNGPRPLWRNVLSLSLPYFWSYPNFLTTQCIG